MTRRIYCFIKFFEKEAWADDLMRGKLYCNTLQYFREREQKEDKRGDPYEGVAALIQPKGKIVKIGSITLKEEDFSGPIVVHSNENLSHNVYSLYAIYIDDEFEEFSDAELSEEELARRVASVSNRLKLHEDCFGMGQHAVFIFAVEPFMDALKHYEESHEIRLGRGLVNYYDETLHDGDFKEEEAIFNKQKGYAHQKEYRIAFRSPTGLAYPIEIGSIEKYAKKMSADDVRKLTISVVPKTD